MVFSHIYLLFKDSFFFLFLHQEARLLVIWYVISKKKKTILLKIELFFTMKKKKTSQTNKLKLVYFGIFLFQEYLQSCQRLMEEVLHFNVTETPSDKIENGSTPSTPTDLQEIHFWQRRLVDCHRTVRVCVNLSIVCKYCNKGLEFSQIAVVFFQVCSLPAPVLFFTQKARERTRCGFLSF